MNSAIYVLYHDSCPDGFGAAWAAWKAIGSKDVEYIPVQYGQPIPATRPGATVYIVDFSYDRETLISLAQRSSRVVVLDHHKTAREALEGLRFPGLSVTFDMDRSGAVLTWEHFHPGQPVPLLLRYVQDRDLWRWALPDSREFSAALALEPRDFGHWDDLAWSLAEGHPATAAFVSAGSLLLRQQAAHVAGLAAKAHPVTIEGHTVPAVNSPLFQSELGEELCRLHPDAKFAAVFFRPSQAEEVWSLRSRNGFDVSAVARQLGGGGHAAAAGFKRAV